MYRSTFSLTSATHEGGWLTLRPERFTPSKKNRCSLCTRLSGPQGQSGRMREISPTPGDFFVLYLYFFALVLSFVITVQHTHNTTIHAPGGIRTRNPSKQ